MKRRKPSYVRRLARRADARAKAAIQRAIWCGLWFSLKPQIVIRSEP